MIYSIIQKSQLEGALRIDAEYYQPEYLQYSENLNKLTLEDLNSLTSKIDVGFVSSMASHFQNDGIPLLRTQNVHEFFTDAEDDVVFIDEEFHQKLKKSQIFSGYLLLARSGSIGNVSVVTENFPVANSADIILIKINSDKIIPEFLAAFLNSKYGKFQIERGSSGGLQGHINLFSLEKLNIPLFNLTLQEEIKNLVLKGLSTIDESKKLYSQAEELLLEELGLKNVVFKDELSSVVNFSDVQKANRIDPEYFQSKYKEIIEKTEKYEGGWDVLGKIVRFKDKNFTPREDKKYKYLALSNISSQGYVQDYQEELGKDLPSRARRKINTGDVIISSIEGSLSSCAIIEEEFDNEICSTGFFVLNSEKINPETLLILFKSDIVQGLLQRGSKGTILTAISKIELECIKIPLIKPSIQSKIAEMVRKSHEARKRSKELLIEAKRKVEEMIEKGGEN